MTDSHVTQDLGDYEFVYTQAVIMHLSLDRAKLFLVNMGKISSKYIFLIENINRHNFDKLCKEVLPDFERVQVDNKYMDGSILLKRK